MITNMLFYTFFQNLVEFSQSRKDSPALLLLEGYGSHMKSLGLIAREKGVQLYCFQPECTHRLQHLYAFFMEPVSFMMRKKYEACSG